MKKIKKERQLGETIEQYQERIKKLQALVIKQFAIQWGEYILLYLIRYCHLSYDTACDIRQELYLWQWKTGYIDENKELRTIRYIIRQHLHQILSKYRQFDHITLGLPITVRLSGDIKNSKKIKHGGSEDINVQEIEDLDFEQDLLQNIIDVNDLSAALAYADRYIWIKHYTIGDLLRLSMDFTPEQIAERFLIDVQSIKQLLSRWRKRLQLRYRS